MVYHLTSGARRVVSTGIAPLTPRDHHPPVRPTSWRVTFIVGVPAVFDMGGWLWRLGLPAFTGHAVGGPPIRLAFDRMMASR